MPARMQMLSSRKYIQARATTSCLPPREENSFLFFITEQKTGTREFHARVPKSPFSNSFRPSSARLTEAPLFLLFLELLKRENGMSEKRRWLLKFSVPIFDGSK
jgi:hypothetical protein